MTYQGRKGGRTNAIETARAACALGAEAGPPADRAVYAAGAAALGAVLAVVNRAADEQRTTQSQPKG